jgi:hypothetical protein
VKAAARTAIASSTRALPASASFPPVPMVSWTRRKRTWIAAEAAHPVRTVSSAPTRRRGRTVRARFAIARRRPATSRAARIRCKMAMKPTSTAGVSRVPSVV